MIKYHFEQKMMKKSKNQLMLDKSMEAEFQKTVELFDEYSILLNHYNMDVKKNGDNRTFSNFLEKLAGKSKKKSQATKDIETVRN